MRKQNDQEFEKIWRRPVVRIGMSTLLLTVVLSFLPSAYLYLKYGAFPSLSVALKAWGMIASIFVAFYFVEPISYYPILGLSGTYMSFLSGNISNLRLPCSAIAQEVIGVDSGTHEAEIISTLGISGSVITNLFFVSLAAFAGFTLMELFPAPVAAAFQKYTVPSVFGAVFAQFAIRFPMLAVIAMSISLTMTLAFRSPLWLTILASVFGTIGIGRALYVKGKIKI